MLPFIPDTVNDTLIVSPFFTGAVPSPSIDVTAGSTYVTPSEPIGPLYGFTILYL